MPGGVGTALPTQPFLLGDPHPHPGPLPTPENLSTGLGSNLGYPGLHCKPCGRHSVAEIWGHIRLVFCPLFEELG